MLRFGVTLVRIFREGRLCSDIGEEVLALRTMLVSIGLKCYVDGTEFRRLEVTYNGNVSIFWEVKIMSLEGWRCWISEFTCNGASLCRSLVSSRAAEGPVLGNIGIVAFVCPFGQVMLIEAFAIL